MRELNFFETHTVAGGGLTNFEVVLFSALTGATIFATLGALYFGLNVYGTFGFAALGMSLFGSLGIGVVCGAGIIKFARQEISI